MHIRHLIFSNRQVAAFTLVELLTATAIMALVLVLLLQILNGILDSTRVQNQQMEAVGSARRVMDVIASDLRNAVISENSSILIPTAGSSNSFALLAARRGTNGATGHRYLAVRYSTNSSNQIIRSYGSSTFSGTNPLADAASAATITPVEPLARGILAFQARILADGTNAYPLNTPPLRQLGYQQLQRHHLSLWLERPDHPLPILRWRSRQPRPGHGCLDCLDR
jgi:type II secretory pathway component PulJ